MQNPASGIGLAYLRKGRGWAGGQTTVSTGENSRDKARRSWRGWGGVQFTQNLEDSAFALSERVLRGSVIT